MVMIRGPNGLRLSEFVQISEFFSIYITDICQTSESFAKSVNSKLERAVKDCSLSQRPKKSIEKNLFMVCQRHGFLAQPGVLGIICFCHCTGSNGTNTGFCCDT